ncbi:3-oxoacyl-ACP synthase III family protein [Nocardia sp. NBC_00511]|uniref:3-oxoacyl-ACP synthase III family protein n=1 Tax=Nocardia sp. NBC_00511 TaxID=2903591 RepID=UPI0030E389ED
MLGTGACVPDRIVGNSEVGAAAGVDDAWIQRKTMIRERRWAACDQATSDLAVTAAEQALEAAGITAADVTAVVVATSTPDRPQPPTASYVQRALGAQGAAFDINAVCSGFVFALAVADALVCKTGGHALVIGADIYSRILNPGDRKTVVLFGDGAGAVVLGPVAAGRGIRDCRLQTFSEELDLITVPAGGSRLPCSAEVMEAGLGYFHMDGRGVRDFVETRLPELVKQFLYDNDESPDRIAHLVPHQANGVLLDRMIPELGLTGADIHRTYIDYGNTGAASIPITLDRAARSGALKPGDQILLLGFGGGMSVGIGLLEW